LNVELRVVVRLLSLIDPGNRVVINLIDGSESHGDEEASEAQHPRNLDQVHANRYIAVASGNCMRGDNYQMMKRKS
jgi:hypothetical protein